MYFNIDFNFKKENIETIIDGHGFTENPKILQGLYQSLNATLINLAKNRFEKSTATQINIKIQEQVTPVFKI